MRSASAVLLIAATIFASAARAETITLCIAVADAATGKLLKQEGDCETRVTPASTFKIVISLMGYDAGFLEDEHAPALPFRKGYPDWVASWKATTDPAAWMKNSVVWYSQQVTKSLGEERFRRYVADFGYGNANVSGDRGKRNGLTNAWLSSSLEISALEQLQFLQKLVRGELPVSPHAREMTGRLLDVGLQPSGWQVYGKTGTGLDRDLDGKALSSRRYGWFVGWAAKEGRTIVFARLIQDSGRQPVPAGPRARDAVLRDLFSSPDAL